jgi:hypothetical protein
MQVRDWMVDHQTGYCGLVVAIITIGGDQVEEIDETDHNLIAAVVLAQPDGTYATIHIEPGTLVPHRETLH